jgi:hypothetical protein
LFVGKHFQKIVKFQEWLGHLETLKNLVDLTIFRPLGMVVKSLPPIPISGLKALRLGGFRSVDLTGLLKLRHFEVHEAECDQIKGKNDIYPRLTSLSGTGSVFEHDDMRNYPNLQSFSWRKIFPRQEISFPQYENIPNLTLTTEILTTLKDFPHWGASVKSSGLEMTARQTRGVPASRYFENLSLFRYRGPDISMFSNVQKLHLFGCMEVTSIFPARNVPYLTIHYCGVTDFSCLGTQHYLDITGCSGLEDKDFIHFENISYIKVSELSYDCSRVSKIVLFAVKTRYVILNDCLPLESVQITAPSELTRLQISRCPILNQVAFEGYTNLLQIDDCKKLKKSDFAKKYHQGIFDGKKVCC